MKFQAPKGTRDFYPQDMAWRNYLLDAWRRVSIRNGFEQVDGPIFEPLDLYRAKSGDGIVNELFHFADRGEREMAIRPEITPTIARMVAAQANALPKPIKWFCMPNLCRAERPQRGRLREFWQWNVDILGSNQPIVDAEAIFVAVDLCRELGLRPEHVQVKISHRKTVRHILSRMGVADDRMLEAFDLLDHRDKLSAPQFTEEASKLGLDRHAVERFEQACRLKYAVGDLALMQEHTGIEDLGDLIALDAQLRAFGLEDWCEYDLGIVRGLAYYTGTVFEIHETSGASRALAGGGRYDQLIEIFGGPHTPAVGFGMGDVVLTDVLMDKGLIPEDVSPRPDVFVLAVDETTAQGVPRIVAELRQQGIHTRMSYKTTHNLGKLLKEATAARSRYALIIEEQGQLVLKNFDDGSQATVQISEAIQAISRK